MLYGRVARTGGSEWTLTIYASERKRRRIAVVIGSTAYINAALLAVGLGRLPLTEYRHGRQSPLVSREPPNRHAKRFR